MDLLVVTNSCSAQKYDEISEIRRVRVIDPQQKFFRLLISGFGSLQGVQVDAISALPVSASSVRKKVFRLSKDYSEKGVIYTYLPFLNGKFMRYLSLVYFSWKYGKKWCGFKRDDCFIIVDAIMPFIAIPMRIIAQKKNIPVCAFVTDIPTLATDMKNRKDGLIHRLFTRTYQRIADHDLERYDAYITLTDSINKKVNIKNKPYLVIEGLTDSMDVTISSVHKRYVMYAGGIYEKYGVKTLVDAFINMGRDDFELFVFGEGSYVEDLIKTQEKYPLVQYKGCLRPEQIVEYEKEAYLLINPRPTNEEFSKYSFPSKTLEYMLSGTPVVSTRLPGIPKEYYDYIYLFSDCDERTICDELNTILNLPRELLLRKGKKAHDFVLKEKNNVAVSSRIVKFLKEHCHG